MGSPLQHEVRRFFRGFAKGAEPLWQNKFYKKAKEGWEGAGRAGNLRRLRWFPALLPARKRGKISAVAEINILNYTTPAPLCQPKMLDILSKMCYTIPTERSLASVTVAVCFLCVSTGRSKSFFILLPCVHPKGGDCMNYLTLSELIQIMMLLLALATFIVSFYHNDKKR